LATVYTRTDFTDDNAKFFVKVCTKSNIIDATETSLESQEHGVYVWTETLTCTGPFYIPLCI